MTDDTTKRAEAMREAFELWQFNGERCPIAKRTPDGGYKAIGNHMKWVCWQAAWQAASERQGWRPISDKTPKGRKVLVAYQNSLGNWRRVIARYYLPQTLELHEDFDCGDGEGFAAEGWYEECQASEITWPIEAEPQLWQPLPSPPTGAKS